MKKTLILGQLVLVLAFLLVLIAPGPSSALDVGVRGSYWLPSMDSDLQVDQGGVSGTNLDLKGDLGVDNEFFPGGEIWFGLGHHSFALGYFQASYNGDTVLNGSPVYNGVTYPNLRADFEMDFKSLDLTYGYRIVKLDAILAGLAVTALVDVKILDIDTRLRSLGVNQSRGKTAFIPAVGVKFNAQLLARILEARAVFLVEPIGDQTVADFIVDVSYTPFPFMDLHAGWRSLILKVDDDEFRLDHSLNGPFVALTISF
ncbi:MAG: hypothetical protein JRG97_06645 [Deltaproteobacteria bacterium]|nr:hypothetical protein [Deltaproteobacteria bacterium]MBW2052628.1 hypothetical protein [Deltaproteobacteria bacterium]MBW2140735.1 hypothetical protein [Deltaproteobacteria bacterium]MBW2324049.1 hypothetical protein [Deltaproteobacteria bacterium]